VDFGRLGLLTDDAEHGVRRLAHGVIFISVCSRHMVEGEDVGLVRANLL
jgi:hypothetical protein